MVVATAPHHAARLDLATACLASGEIEGAGAKLSEVFAAGTYTASITIRLRDLAALLGSEPYRGARSAVDLRAHFRGDRPSRLSPTTYGALMTTRPTPDPSVTDRGLLTTKAYGTGEHLAARQSLYRWQTPRHDLPGIVVNELADVRGAVADVGCGNGKFVTRVRGERPDLRVLPMDVSPGILGAVPGAVVADVQQLPVADGVLGAVLALHMLYHVQDQALAVRELGRVLAPGGIAVVSTNSRTDKRELEQLWRRAAGDVLGIEKGPARVQLSARFTLEDAPAILGQVFGDLRTIPLPGVIEVTEAEPVVAHLASYEAWADKEGVPFRETIERARERVDEVIETEGSFRITCLGGILVCRGPKGAS